MTAERKRLTVSAFFDWLGTEQSGQRFELVDGMPVARAPERAAHARIRSEIWRQLHASTAHSSLPCEAFADGMTVVVDEHTAYEPNVVIHCGDRVAPDALVVPSPVVIVEVLSPSSRGRDAGAKLDGYFQLPSVRHYLLVKTESATVIHHERDDGGDIHTRIVATGALRLDPPGLDLDLGRLDPR